MLQVLGLARKSNWAGTGKISQASSYQGHKVPADAGWDNGQERKRRDKRNGKAYTAATVSCHSRKGKLLPLLTTHLPDIHEGWPSAWDKVRTMANMPGQ